MIQSTPASFRRLLLLAGLLPVFTALAQESEPAKLTPYVVTTTRTPIAVTTAGSAIDTLSADEFARMQLTSLNGVLGSVPGAPMAASGAPGAVTSLFMRGTNSNQTLFLADGIRMSDPNTDYAVVLGGACLGACDNLEVAHGPQSTLYGGEAVGGVVAIRGQRGNGPARSSLTVEAGSFGTVQGAVSTQGGDAQSGYAFSAAGGHTDNERANNKFDSATYTLRLDRRLSESVAVGMTWRGFNGHYGSPGAAVGYGANDPDNTETESNQLVTVFADLTYSPSLTSHIVLGGQDRRYVADTPGSIPPLTLIKNRRAVLDWQSTYTANEQHRVTGGFTAELNTTRNTGFGDINQRQKLFAFFAQDEWTPVKDVYLTGGLRSDDFDTFGRATTGRITAAWLTNHDRLKFRASYGTGFRAPSFLDLYGEDYYYRGNPNLNPEKGRGWDAGVDYYFAENRGTLSVTWFQNDLSNLITYVFPKPTDPVGKKTTVDNIESARTEGVELAAKFDLPGQWKARFAYTYLEAQNLTEDSRLLRRPRHSGSLDVWHEFGHGFSTGVGAAFAAEGMDVDAASYLPIAQPSYTVVRLYGAWQATKQLTVKVRLENLLNRKYEQVNGYPQLGFGAFGGVEWKF